MRLLFIAAEFAYQHRYENYWQSKQNEHEEKSEAHHGNCLLSCLIVLTVYIWFVKTR